MASRRGLMGVLKGFKEGYIEQERSRRDFRTKVYSAVLGKIIEKKLTGTKPVYGPDDKGKFGKLAEVEENAVVLRTGSGKAKSAIDESIDDAIRGQFETDSSSATGITDELPDPSTVPEGSIAEDSETGEKKVVRNGKWVLL